MLILTKPLFRPQQSVMRVLHLSFFLLCLSLVATRSVCNGKSVEIEGFGECTDCTQPSTTNAFSGLLVSIECKDGSGYVRSEGKLDEQGKFRVSLPEELVEGGKLKGECRTRLQSTSGTTLCPVPNLEASSSKITVLKSSTEDTHKFETTGKLKFSQAACTSQQSLFHNPDYYHKHHPIFKKKKHLPHPPIYTKPFPPIPVHKKPLPPPIPVYKKPLHKPIYKKPFPPIPVYKKPLPPPIPVYEKPLHKPIYKKPFPPIPVYKKPLPPPIPVYKKPLYKPIYKKPHTFPHPPPISIPIKKKPCPPLPIYKKPLPSFPFPPKPFP